MSDLISRQAVIDRINKLIEVEKKQGTDDWGYGRERVKAYEAMLYMVKSEYIHPSVEPERKPVKWIDVPQYRGILFECDFCHKYQGTIKHKYCPNCGAKMEVET